MYREREGNLDNSEAEKSETEEDIGYIQTDRAFRQLKGKLAVRVETKAEDERNIWRVCQTGCS